MDKHTYCVIMAGGIGSRFWPKSRQSKPKQFLDILGTGKSFIRMTYERFEKLAPAENFLVVTNARYKDLVLEQIPELGPEQVLCEPVGRNTAPCICYAAYGLQKRDPGAKMIVTPADHLILNEEDFRAIIGECLDFIDDRAALMTVGIKPTRPETGYGYIQVSDDRTISKVKCFTEKPNLELAQTFLQCGEFLWNSGIFVWKVGDIIEAVRTYLPEHHALFSDIQPVLGTSEEAEAIARVFSECRSISIDYGVMEKANNVYVRRGEFGWSDVGTWGSLYQHARKDRYATAKPEKGCYTDENTRSCIVSLPEGKVAVINGLKEYIVVDTEDVLLICPRSEEQNIKKFIDEVKYCRITPFDTKQRGRTIDSERMYDNMMNKFKYGGLKENPDISLDETVIRMCYTHRRLFNQLAQQLLKEGKKEKALKVLQRAEEEIPGSIVPHEAIYGHSIELGRAWLSLGHKAEGGKLLEAARQNAKEYLEWYLSLSTPRLLQSSRECLTQLYILNSIAKTWEAADKKKAEECIMEVNNYASRCHQRGISL